MLVKGAPAVVGAPPSLTCPLEGCAIVDEGLELAWEGAGEREPPDKRDGPPFGDESEEKVTEGVGVGVGCGLAANTCRLCWLMSRIRTGTSGCSPSHESVGTVVERESHMMVQCKTA